MGRASAEQRAQVSGCVRDASDAVLPNTELTAVNQDTGIRRSTRSSANGDYGIASLPAGVYKITVRKPGFQTIAQLDVHLSPAQNARIDFTMQVGSMREVITILGSPPLLNSQDATVGAIPSADLLDRLPLNGRELLSIAALAPGVVTTPATLGEAGQFSANGQRPNANYFTVDGASANTGVSGSVSPAQFSGGTLPSMTAFGGTQTLASREETDEVRIQTSSFAPEFGRTPGANLAVTTRSGTNELRGAVFYGVRNQVLDANDWFANRAGLDRAPARLNDWGAALGGPLRRDRTFFFAAYERLRLMEPFTSIFPVPSLTSRTAAPAVLQPVLKAFPVPNGQALGAGISEFSANVSRPSQLDLGSLRIDHAVTSRISIFGRFQKAPSSTQSGFAQVDRSSFDNQSFTFGAAALLSPNFISDFRLNRTHTSVASRWQSTGEDGSIPVNLESVFPPLRPPGTLLYGFAIGGVGQILAGQGSSSSQGQWNLIETLTWNKDVHTLRFGIDYDRLTPSRDHVAATLAGAYQNLAELLAGAPMLLSSAQADQASSLVESLSVFAQDTWRISPRLTATYGLRWELTPAPSYRFGGMVPPPITTAPSSGSPLWPMRYTQLAPRFGIAYRLASATVLRVGWGIFHNVEFGVATDPINSLPYNRWQFSTAVPGSAATGPQSAIFGNVFSPNLQLPYAREWNLSLEHAFRMRDVLAVSYVGSAGRRLLRREAAIQTVPQASPIASNPVAGDPIATNGGRSDYNALEVQYRRKLSAGIQAVASYSWSHSLDNGSWDSGIYLSPAIGGGSDRASSSFDVRHNVSAGVTWQSHHWLLSGIVTARSGFPIEVIAIQNLLGLGFDDYPRPNLVAGVPVWISDSGAPGGRRLNPVAFAAPTNGAQGTLGRNSITGFSLAQVDLELGREFSLRETAVFALRVEAFNATNHPQFGDPVRFLDNPLFGQSTSMLNLMLGSGTPHSGIAPAFQLGGARVVQFSLRLRF